MVGKIILYLVWVALILGNFYCIKNMSELNFTNWCILSVSAFGILQLVVDPLLYFILAVVMIPRQS